VKSVVIFDRYNGVDLKPGSLFNDYIKRTAESINDYFVTGAELKRCSCPGCESKDVASRFEKFGLRYNECKSCGTLYISPRPSDKDVARYYKESPARILWRNELSKKTDKARKEKIIKPRFEWIEESTREYLDDPRHYADVNTDQQAYVDAMMKSRIFAQKTLINPFLEVDSKKTGIAVAGGLWDTSGIQNDIDVISLFEVTDHTSDINLLFQKVDQWLRPGGLCFITSILISGFDFQVLWDKSENLFPPDRLNVFSSRGVSALLKRHEFECLEFSTPGILDLENVKRTAAHNPRVSLPRFIRNLVCSGEDTLEQAFQEFLQANLLSSYARMVIRKK
jgi:Zn ribbon nucleic-acid-binding protein